MYSSIFQKRFLLSDDDTDDNKWYVPITYTTSADPSRFTETTTKEWLTPDADLTILLDNEDNWIILNNQQVGYYRVNYDKTLLSKIETALKSDDLGNIDEMSRSQLVDDQLNLGRAGKAEYADVLNFLSFMKRDTSYYSWSPFFNGFSYLFKRTNDESLRNSMKVMVWH